MRGKDAEKFFFGLLKAGKELLEEKLAPALNKRITNINVKIIYGEDYEITLTLDDGSRVIITAPHNVEVRG